MGSLAACWFERFAAGVPTGACRCRCMAWGVGTVGNGCERHSCPFNLLQKVMPHASTSPPAIATKLVIDQFMFAPACTVRRACKRLCSMSI